MNIRDALIVLLALLALPAVTAAARKAFEQIEDKPGLPRVLLIGDSISIGYTLQTRARLKDVANVHRPAANCGPTTRGLEHLDAWLGEGDWDVIHFNWGLHDLKYIGEGSDKLVPVDTPGAHQQVPIDAYEKNLDTLVRRLKKTGAKLIWRNTTPVPPGARGRVVGDSAKYNEAALRVMKKHDVQVHDMFSFVKPRVKELMRPANVHFTPKGNDALADEVAGVIKQALDQSSK